MQILAWATDTESKKYTIFLKRFQRRIQLENIQGSFVSEVNMRFN